MYEGKNIHYSEVDHRLLCSYSTKICKQRRLNGYAFCSRHILEDPSAPFKQCIHIGRNKQRCLNPIQKDKPAEMCNVHINKMLAAANKEKEKTQVGAISPPSYTANGAITPTTPPSTPTQDPQRLSIMERLKNKFTRVQNCPTEDVIVNVVDDSDPYAFPDNDPEPVKTSVLQVTQPVQSSSGQSEPAESSQKSHQSAIVNVATTTTTTTSCSSSSNVDISVIATVDSNTSIINNVLNMNPSFSDSSSVLMTPTPSQGETPIAKLFPEIAGKLHSSPTSLERQITSSIVKTKISTGQSVSRGKQSNNSSRNSRTMNKLESKIAQNRIKDKQEKAKQQKHNQTVSLITGGDVNNSESNLMSVIPTVSTGVGAMSSSETTSTIFSLGSIPSLGTFLPQEAATATTGGLQHQQKLTPFSFPVALPLLGHHNMVTSNNVISSPSMATVIPATVFTPFPNLAGALSSLHQSEAGKQTNKQVSKEKSTATKGAKNKSGKGRNSSSSKCEKKVRSSKRNNLKALKNIKENELLKEGLPLGGLRKGGLNCENIIPEEGLNIGDIIQTAVSNSSQEMFNSPAFVTSSSSFVKLSTSSLDVHHHHHQNVTSGNKSTNKKLTPPRMSRKLQRPRHLPLPKLNASIACSTDDNNISATMDTVDIIAGGASGVGNIVNTTEYSSNNKNLCSSDQKPVIKNNKSKLTETKTVFSTQSAIFSVGMLSSSSSSQQQQKQHTGDVNNDRLCSVSTQESIIKSYCGDTKLGKWNNLKTDSGHLIGGKSELNNPSLLTKSIPVSSSCSRKMQFDNVNDVSHEQLLGNETNAKVRVKRKLPGLLSDADAKRTFRRHSAVSAYMCCVKERRNSSSLLPFGVESSSSDDEDNLLVSSPLCYSDDDDVKPCHNELSDPTLLSTIRSTKLQLVKSKVRRNHKYVHKLSRLTSSYHTDKSSGALALIKAARKDAKTASQVVLASATSHGAEDVMRNAKRLVVKTNNANKTKRKCLVVNPDTEKSCGAVALPYTNHCVKHILYNIDQQLFDYCTAKFSNNTQCCEPVFDIRHELPLCPEHALKADNYQKNLEQKQPKKPRKKTKPSALTRPPKKGKKRKNQRNRQNSENVSANVSTASTSVTDVPVAEDTEDKVTDKKEVSFPVLPENEEIKLESEDISDLDHDFDETFSPGTIDKNLELPLDMVEATKFLDKHDLGDMLNKLPDDAFDFTGVLAKNGDLTPTKEETDMLEAAIAEASHEFNLDHSHHQTNDNIKFSIDAQTAAIGELPLVPIDDTKDTLEDLKKSFQKMQSQNESADYLSDDTDENNDELTKQIASQLMQHNPLSDDEEDMDDDNINNLASSLTANDLRSISRALSGSELDMSLTADNMTLSADGIVHVAPSAQGQTGATNNFQQQQQQQQQNDTVVFPKLKDNSDVGGQLAQILEAFGSDQTGMDTLQQNIRMFLNEDNASQTQFSASVGNNGTSVIPQHHHQEVSGLETQSILHNFLTTGNVLGNVIASNVGSSPMVTGVEINQATNNILMRQNSNNSTHSSGSGVLARGLSKYPPISQPQTSGYTRESESTPPPNVSVTEIPPNMSVSDIPSCSSIADITAKVNTSDTTSNTALNDVPLCVHYPGPPNVTVTAIPSSFKNLSNDWKSNIGVTTSIGMTTVVVGTNVIQIPVITNNLQQGSPVTLTASSVGNVENIQLNQNNQRMFFKESPQRKSRRSSSSSGSSPKVSLPSISQQQASSQVPVSKPPFIVETTKQQSLNVRSGGRTKGTSPSQNLVAGGNANVQSLSNMNVGGGIQPKIGLSTAAITSPMGIEVSSQKTRSGYYNKVAGGSAQQLTRPQLLQSGSKVVKSSPSVITTSSIDGSPSAQQSLSRQNSQGNFQSMQMPSQMSDKQTTVENFVKPSFINASQSLKSGNQPINQTATVFQSNSNQSQKQPAPVRFGAPMSSSSIPVTNAGQRSKVSDFQGLSDNDPQAFVSALLERMAKQQQQLTPQQQKQVQQLQQTEITASGNIANLPGIQGNLLLNNKRIINNDLQVPIINQAPPLGNISPVFPNQMTSSCSTSSSSPNVNITQPRQTVVFQNNQAQKNLLVGSNAVQQIQMPFGNQMVQISRSNVDPVTNSSQQVTSGKIPSFSSAFVPQTGNSVVQQNILVANQQPVSVTSNNCDNNISVQISGNNTRETIPASSNIQKPCIGESQLQVGTSYQTVPHNVNNVQNNSPNVINLITQDSSNSFKLSQKDGSFVLPTSSNVSVTMSTITDTKSPQVPRVSPASNTSAVHSVMKIPSGVTVQQNMYQNLPGVQQNSSQQHQQQIFTNIPQNSPSVVVDQVGGTASQSNILHKTLLLGVGSQSSPGIIHQSVVSQSPQLGNSGSTSGLMSVSNMPSINTVNNSIQNVMPNLAGNVQGGLPLNVLTNVPRINLSGNNLPGIVSNSGVPQGGIIPVQGNLAISQSMQLLQQIQNSNPSVGVSKTSHPSSAMPSPLNNTNIQGSPLQIPQNSPLQMTQSNPLHITQNNPSQIPQNNPLQNNNPAQIPQNNPLQPNPLHITQNNPLQITPTNLQEIVSQINITGLKDLPALLSTSNLSGLSASQMKLPNVNIPPQTQLKSINIQCLPAPIPSINIQGQQSGNISAIQNNQGTVSTLVGGSGGGQQISTVKPALGNIQDIRQQVPALNVGQTLPIQMPVSGQTLPVQMSVSGQTLPVQMPVSTFNVQQIQGIASQNVLANYHPHPSIGGNSMPLLNLQGNSSHHPQICSASIPHVQQPVIVSSQIKDLSTTPVPNISPSSLSTPQPSSISCNSKIMSSQIVTTLVQSFPSPLSATNQMATAPTLSNMRANMSMPQIMSGKIQGIPAPIPSSSFQNTTQQPQMQLDSQHQQITTNAPAAPIVQNMGLNISSCSSSSSNAASQGALSQVCANNSTTLQGQNLPHIPTPAPLPTVAAFAPIPANVLQNGLPQLAAALQSQGLPGSVGVKFAYALPAGIIAGLSGGGGGSGGQNSSVQGQALPRQPFLIATLPPVTQPAQQHQPQQQQQTNQVITATPQVDSKQNAVEK